MLNYTSAVLLIVYADVKLEAQERISKQKDLKVMKVVHDLKNPILSIKQIVNGVHIDDKLEQSANHSNGYLNPRSSIHASNKSLNVNSATYDPNNPTQVSRCNSGNFNLNANYLTNPSASLKVLSVNYSDQGNSDDLKEAVLIISEIQKNVNNELEDIEEMIENLKTEFKSKNKMKFKEEIKPVESKEFLESFKNSHCKLAESGRNRLLLTLSKGFPETLEIPKSLVKRILNNFISNSLKHTSKGQVEVTFTIKNKESMCIYEDFVQVGAPLPKADKYICVTVSDNGKGVPPAKLLRIFTEKESDESAANWDGCGLGLPICEKLAAAIGARIFYNSKENEWTLFALCLPWSDHFDNPNVQDQLTGQAVRRKESIKKEDLNTIFLTSNGQVPVVAKESVERPVQLLTTPYVIDLDFKDDEDLMFEHEHVCDCLLIAEDSKSVLKRYGAYLGKHNISHQMFLNGSECLTYLKKELEYNCAHCRRMLVVTDMYMPYMNGIELVETIRKIDLSNKVKVYLLSADEPGEEFKVNSKFDQLFTKPLQMNKLKEWQLQLSNYNISQSKNDSQNSQFNSSGIIRNTSDKKLSEIIKNTSIISNEKAKDKSCISEEIPIGNQCNNSYTKSRRRSSNLVFKNELSEDIEKYTIKVDNNSHYNTSKSITVVDHDSAKKTSIENKEKDSYTQILDDISENNQTNNHEIQNYSITSTISNNKTSNNEQYQYIQKILDLEPNNDFINQDTSINGKKEVLATCQNAEITSETKTDYYSKKYTEDCFVIDELDKSYHDENDNNHKDNNSFYQYENDNENHSNLPSYRDFEEKRMSNENLEIEINSKNEKLDAIN